MLTKLCFVIPLLNEADGVQETIQCLREQSCQEFDAIFVDSGSSDRTVELVLAQKRDRDLILTFQDNLGISRNWKRGLSEALLRSDASHFMFLGGDDVLSAEFVETVYKTVRLKTSIGILAPHFETLGSGENIADFSDFARGMLLRDWRFAHLCYGIYTRNLITRIYVPSLARSGPEFDWIVSLHSTDAAAIEPIEVTYFKRVKGIDYGSQYYLGSIQTSRAPTRFEKALRHHILQPLELFLTSRMVGLATGTSALGLRELLTLITARLKARLVSGS